MHIVDRYAQHEEDGSILDPVTRYNTETHMWVPTDPARNRPKQNLPPLSVNEEEQRFLQAMRDYENNAKTKYKTGINVDEVHSMEDLWQSVDLIAVKYKNRETEKDMWNRVRNAFRNLGDHEAAVEGWLGLVPAESNYMSVVCGGLKFILHAIARAKEVRDAIIGGLCNIPLLLGSAQRVLAIHKTSTPLRACSDALYVAVLTALGHMLVYAQKHTLGKALGALLRQSSFELTLTRSIENVQRCRDKFNEEANVCNMEMASQIKDLSQDIDKTTIGIRETLKDFMVLIYNEKKRTQALQDHYSKMANAKIDRNNELLEKATPLLNTVADLLKSSPRLADEAYVSSQSFYAPSSNAMISFVSGHRTHGAAQEASVYSERDLRDIVRSRLIYEEHQARTDVVANHQLAGRLCLEDQDRCVYVIRSPELAAWIRTPTSTILVVNGNSPKIQFQSPWSFTAAKLVYALDMMRANSPASKDQIAAVHFFCGEHVDTSKDINSPTTIANEILSQLLSSFKHIDLIPLIKMGDFEGSDLEAVCQRIECVLDRLPVTTFVFCIIDGLSFYLADQKTSEQANKLLRWLIKLTRHQQRARKRLEVCTFKLFLTAPLRLQGSYVKKLRANEVMNVPVRPPRTGGFTEMKWEAGAGGQLGMLG
ncbi:hypothetical protein ASPBRDRAFT_192736 [Aspergillus brasiliensis CBS 101740]|uniref:DUF7708 domain-containing protein n=1 Tax=Aspergillus brasiliensis (strain CBS 101740 / IMI 381727 / IBT 21946) TaxID=767769 RepID=A0A1L9UY69_ASPBC|nr:hypothetical protein ASPBRDRAFT_192736 [Aspergillus brasiliensis CBS 101740]